ncbi:putative F-box domain, FBD domain, leucine-rich repeat domain, L domain-containing protein [Medicago truncatula]|uniref:F-box/FBD/LRR protein n=1 Tax=Medicago truncatula TaxID=3880 RepID=G7KUP4_MEDTR|nr:putative FBD-associated F-box protein At5g56820 [Medicago truncatula]AES77941.2 F-box/FBD/LRR protein [Medicago truncatula]RHN44703.1 putative F-box domain, FBD domain, leucine-rich repeat domain, L domain-containing protein [Medicago truncatula]
MAEEEEDGEDRISSLSDDLLVRILSNLHTRESVSTCVLSKRWVHVFKALTCLRLDDENGSLLDALDEMRHRTDLTSFDLSIFTRRSGDIVTVAEKAVRNIVRLNLSLNSLSIYGILNMYLTRPVFNSRTLVELKLHRVCIAETLSVASLPSLKVLSLSRVQFDTKSVFLSLLSAVSRVLEELRISSPTFSAPICDREADLFPCLRGAFLHKLPWEMLVLFISVSHLLTTLEFTPMDSRQMEEGEENVDNWINPIIVPVCLTNQLKSCLLHGYKSTTCQDRFVRYVMLNSNILKTISIKCLPSTDTTVKYRWLKKLASWRRSSTTSLLFD